MTGIVDVGLVLAIASTLASVYAWVRAKTRAAYAREREYSHILKGIEQQNANIQNLFHELDHDHKAILKELDEVGDRLQRLEFQHQRGVNVG